MGAALNSLLDETKADGTYKRIFDEVASNTTETLGCAPQVRFLTPEAHNLMHPIPKSPSRPSPCVPCRVLLLLFLAVWDGHTYPQHHSSLPPHHSSRGRPHWVIHFNAHAFSPPS